MPSEPPLQVEKESLHGNELEEFLRTHLILEVSWVWLLRLSIGCSFRWKIIDLSYDIVLNKGQTKDLTGSLMIFALLLRKKVMVLNTLFSLLHLD